MATFAEFPPNTMANDFTLYPYQEPWNNNDQNYLANQVYSDNTFAAQAPYDSFSSHTGYNQADHFNYPAGHNFQHLQQSKANLQAPSSHDSPATSTSVEYQHPPILSSTSDSGASVQSSISSAMGSPANQPPFPNDWTQQSHLAVLPEILQPDNIAPEFYASTGFEIEPTYITEKGCVDPSLIQPTFSPIFNGAHYPEQQVNLNFNQAPSPAPSKTSVRSPRMPHGKMTASPSPYLRTQSWAPYPTMSGSRRPSISSEHSRHSQGSISSSEDSNKGLCPMATCGRHVKDLKAHMLTHQNERPEKCPIPMCEYHTKGFARKYDKNRHTLTHYKGTMVCGFCPGSGSAAEKSFNRADVFKRHLTSVHGVEQTPPNARKKSPMTAPKRNFGSRDVSGMCSTCGVTFASAQDFYEHLDDCVLRVVQQSDPSEAINEKLLSSLADDEKVQETMEKNMLPTGVDYNAPTSFDEEDDADEDDEADDDVNDDTYGSRSGAKSNRSGARKTGASSRQLTHSRGVSSQHAGNGTQTSSGEAVGKQVKKGLTYSKNGVPLSGPSAGKGSKRRKNYPLSWGAASEKMKMKKRVLCVYDGQRRLWKDDMMLDADHEVRIPYGRSWVTDLDLQTLRRAEGVHNATEEEKGPWLDDDGELERLMA